MWVTVLRSLWVRTTWATSDRRTGWPAAVPTVTRSMSCRSSKRLRVRTMYSALRSRRRPPEALMFSWARAVFTWSMVRPSAARRVSSTSTRISSSRPPETWAAATPLRASISFLSTSSATARSCTSDVPPDRPTRSTGSWDGSYFRSTGMAASSGSRTRSSFSRTSRAA